MEFIEIKSDKKSYLELLLLADEQENMIDRYLEKGIMYVLYDNDVKAVCVVIDDGNSVLEIKNIAVLPEYQHMGYGKIIIEFLENKFRNSYNTLKVGTGDSPLTVPFYEKCGFQKTYTVKNFFTENYDHEIFECGKKLTDMIYFEKKL